MLWVYQHVWSPQIQAGFLLNITISRGFGESLNDLGPHGQQFNILHTLGVPTQAQLIVSGKDDPHGGKNTPDPFNKESLIETSGNTVCMDFACIGACIDL